MIYKYLVIVVGPSGSGKDTLISGAIAALGGNRDFYFVTREITRPSNAGGELHFAVPEDEFLRRRDSGIYAISWHAHNTWYGINQSIENYLAEGRVVVFNGSRAAVNEAKTRFPGVNIIFIDAPEIVLSERLTGRGRESDPQIMGRMIRNRQLTAIPEGAIVLSNTGSVTRIVDKFVGVLQKILAGEDLLKNDVYTAKHNRSDAL